MSACLMRIIVYRVMSLCVRRGQYNIHKDSRPHFIYKIPDMNQVKLHRTTSLRVSVCACVCVCVCELSACCTALG